MNNLITWNRRDPLQDFDALISRAFTVPEARPAGDVAFSPAAEVVRDGDDALVRLDLPGVDVEKDVSVEMQDGQLVVRGERKSAGADNDFGHVVREVRYGSFRRAFKLPAQVAAEAVTADYDSGVLTVRVAGVHKVVEPRRIPVRRGSTVEGSTSSPE